MPKITAARDNFGFTLVELLVAVAVIAITLSIAVPSMRTIRHKTHLRVQANRLMTSINLVRSEAIKRNTTVSMCPSTSAAASASLCSGTFADGWLVYSNTDRDRTVDVGTDEVIGVFEGLPEGYSLSNRAGTRATNELITFFTDGSSRRSRTLQLCAPPGVSVASWSVVMNRVGRARLAMGWGNCPAH